MEVEFITTLAKIRLTIGFLGEREQYGWWQSSFFTQGNAAFLSPLFSRTRVLAQCNGVSQAAALVHDERIGIGNVYHLFRLPEEMEQRIHRVLHELQPGELTDSKDTALTYLRKGSIQPAQSGLGPTRVGDIKSLPELDAWKRAAGLYYDAFQKGIEIFPYFADIS